jgi:DsbC/DsbD-like thiol-disulfide interchange protein
MFILSRLITFLAVLAFFGPQGHAQDASPWAEGHRSRVRLLAGEEAGRLAGVEIILDAGFKTYWRNPGEAGLPPAFDWAKSANVKAAEVLWPAPSRSEDAGGVSYGYHGQVLFPVRIRPQDPAKPVSLALKIDYGVCKDICIPAQAELSLKLPASVSPAVRTSIKAALARVPNTQPLGADADLAVLAVDPAGLAAKPQLAVKIRAPAGSQPALFVEAPDNWFLLAASGPTSAEGEGVQTFSVDVLERPQDATGPIQLRFTLVAGDRAIESTMSLDAARLRR